MPDIKEKLVGLVAKAKREYANDYSDRTEDDYIVETLLDNGVTIQEEDEMIPKHDMEIILHEVAERAKPKWISVEERLPEPGTEVLTYAKMPDVSWADISVAVYNPEIYQPGWKFVTHWTPLPEPPKEGAGNG